VRHSSITPTITLLSLHPDIPGYERFFGTYLLTGEKRVLVDVGPSAVLPSLLSALDNVGVGHSEIDYVVLTHIHMDHSGGIGAALKHLDRARVVAHSRAVPHLIDPARLWQASRKTLGELADQYGRIEPVPEGRIVPAADGMKLDLGAGLDVEVYLTPGHAQHHLSLFDRGSGVLLVGEAAGVCIDGALRPSTPPPFRLEETLASIDRLVALEPRRICYAHLGCYDNPRELLEEAKRQLLSWREVARADREEGGSPEETLERLRREDPVLAYLADLSPTECEREVKMLVNSVAGLAE
jgi:glyoxylase-like metal-dependent hydrolase (beta-lactamase superfamily II)